MTTADHQRFEAGDVRLHSGETLANARLAYVTYGELNSSKDNAIVFTTRVGGTHADNKYLIGPGHALDPDHWFVVVPNQLGNGLSSSPSNTPAPQDRARFPMINHHDNADLQHRLMTEVFGVKRLALAVGFSMGGQQAYHWAVKFPDAVARLAPICCTARTTPHTEVFVEGLKAALTTDPAWDGGDYNVQPQAGFNALARVWAGWGLSQAFYRERRFEGMGFATIDEFLTNFWEARYAAADANNLLSMLTTWRASDVSDTAVHGGDLAAALGAITARTLVMPGRTDLYFPPEDNEIETAMIPDAECRVIPSDFGHAAGGGANQDDVEFLDAALRELLHTDA